MSLFYENIHDMMEGDCISILKRDLEEKKALKNYTGNVASIQTFYAWNIYNILFKIVNALSNDIKGLLLYQVVKVNNIT